MINMMNPFDKQLKFYKRMTAIFSIVFILFGLLLDKYFNIPRVDAASILGDVYLIYLICEIILMIAFVGMFFVLGITFQTWQIKKATDKSLEMIGNEFIQKKEKEEV